MIRHFLQRLLYTLPALWLILTMVFLMIHIVPGDPVLQMLGQDARAEDLAQLRHSLGLDQPLGVQYVRYLEGLARGDWGQSMRYAAPVRPIVLQRFPATLELSLAALAAADSSVHNGIPHEMVLLDVYNALRALDELTGATTAEDILNLIFSTFCIGK